MPEQPNKKRPEEQPIPALTDSDLMPFGKYAKTKTKLANVPAAYLLWLHDEGCNHAGVKRYILENFEALRKEAGRKK